MLQVMTDFSIGESILKCKDIVNFAKENNYKSIAVADIMSISAIPEMSLLCQESGIKFIAGVKLRIVDDVQYKNPTKKQRNEGAEVKENNPYYVILYCRNEAALSLLSEFVSLGFQDDHYLNEKTGPRVSTDEFMNFIIRNNNSFVVVIPDDGLLAYRPDAVEFLEEIDSICPMRINIGCVSTPYYKAVFNKFSQSSCLFIASRPMQYLKGQADAKDAMQWVHNNMTALDGWRTEPYVRDLHLLTEDEMDQHKRYFLNYVDQEDFRFLRSDSLENLVTSSWSKKEVTLPKISNNELDDLKSLAYKGLEEKQNTKVFGSTISNVEIYKERLEYEIGIIADMGFIGYFLVVHDLVNYAKQKNIPIGPGRGSVGGSLLAFVLGITAVDPMRFGLIFERFMNPDRRDYPDIDLDFSMMRRKEVIQYLVDKYGEDRVSSISNYTKLGCASSLRDVGRVHNVPLGELDCTKEIPTGYDGTLEESAMIYPGIKKFKRDYPKVWEIACQLNGCNRSIGKHAAGIVIGTKPLKEMGILDTRAKHGFPLIGWDKVLAEQNGLVKLDVLGLKTLDVIDLARQKIGQDFNPEEIDVADSKAMTGFSRGNSIGVFQFESGGMRGMLKELAVLDLLRFEDLIAANALYRPGPLESGLKDQYVKIKQFIQEPKYEHPDMEEILVNSNGVMVYQEDTMNIAKQIGGFTGGEADDLRKAIGKKKIEALMKLKDKFVSGAVSNGLTEAQAIGVFDKIEKFGGYGFNKSHACAYSLIALQCMYIKQHYPVEFYGAALTFASEDQLSILIRDANNNGIKVMPPDINVSTQIFEKAEAEENALVAPLNAVKLITEKGVDIIRMLRAKHGGAFKSFSEFEKAVIDAKVARSLNSRARQNLFDVGAFDNCIDEEAVSQFDPDRIQAQNMHMPGLMRVVTPVSKVIEFDSDKVRIAKIITNEIFNCKDCSLKKRGHAFAVPKKRILGMIVVDAPTNGDLQVRQIAHRSEYLQSAIVSAGLSADDFYITALVKSKPESGKPSNEAKMKCAQYIDREIALIQPELIIALGGEATRKFLPGSKGSWEDLSQTIEYDQKLGRTIIVGPNPNIGYFNAKAVEELHAVFDLVASAVTHLQN